MPEQPPGPTGSLNIVNDPQAEALETITYMFRYPGKRQKRLCSYKGDTMLQVLKWPEPWTFQFTQRFYESTSRGGSFVEVGANIGTTTVFAADFFRKGYAFEPSSRNLPILRKNLELNGVQNVEIWPMALSSAPGKSHLHLDWGSTTGSDSLVPTPGSTRSEPVVVNTLDLALPDVTDVTFIQIDTEGYDIKVLQGAREFIRRQKQRPVIVMEFAPRSLVLAHSSIGELISFLDEFGYSVMYPAHLNPSTMSRTMLAEMFAQWQTGLGWIDIYLLP